MTAVLACRDVAWRPRRGADPIVDGVTLELRAGELLALAGPNGAGKSTLLSLLAGERPPSDGVVELDGMPLAAFEPRALARRRAVMRQHPASPFGFFAYEIVELGRSPWKGLRGRTEDAEAIERAMDRAQVSELALRRASVLSGGEQARLALARVLAQETAILMLDEPTASLDPRHQHAVLAVARELAAEGRSVLAVLHDLGLAADYADRVAVMHRGRLASCGPPAEALADALLEEVYEVPVAYLKRGSGLRPASFST
ncbi:MAG: heme transport system ATP-binding protein [Thermoleophilaceae bacterium]|jgi:iron complex transport system ATP-binding protein|nr:heme transport system ATP-binding protein [Thermoleophilaceae bacterium]